MEPLKVETDALKAILLQPLESFVTDKERDERGEEKAEALAHKRMFAQAVKAVDKARGERTLWMVVLRFGRGSATFYSAYGPYSTQGQAEKAVVAMSSTFEYTAYATVPMRNAEGLAALLGNLDNEAESKGDYGIVAEDARLFRLGWKGESKDRHTYMDKAKFLERVM